MSSPTVIEEQPLSLYDAKKELTAIKDRDTELSFRAGRCEEYVNHFTPLSQKAADEIRKKLEALEIPRFRTEHIAKLIDILPATIDDIKMVLSGYNTTIKAENIKKIDEVLAEYRK